MSDRFSVKLVGQVGPVGFLKLLWLDNIIYIVRLMDHNHKLDISASRLLIHNFIHYRNWKWLYGLYILIYTIYELFVETLLLKFNRVNYLDSIDVQLTIQLLEHNFWNKSNNSLQKASRAERNRLSGNYPHNNRRITRDFNRSWPGTGNESETWPNHRVWTGCPFGHLLFNGFRHAGGLSGRQLRADNGE